MARLLYTLPTVKTYELGLHGAQAVDRFGGLGSMTTLVVRELCLSLDNFWFSAHLLDLLHHAGALGQAKGAHFSEHLILCKEDNLDICSITRCM